jgi:class 3 adenylate cyclase/alpha-beta hydrolase superfamily lysophospholipase
MTIDAPQTRYAETGGLNIAYQVFGNGERDLLCVPGIISNVDLIWDGPLRGFFEGLAQRFRVITFDRRGQGMSDRFDGIPSFEERLDDLRVVMTAANSQRATLFGMSQGGPIAVLFAAAYPNMVERLILYGSMPRFAWAEDYPFRQKVDRDLLDQRVSSWGTGALSMGLMPSKADDPEFVRWAARYERMSATPKTIRAQTLADERIDVRDILPQLHIATTVIHRRNDPGVIRENGQYMADKIPGAVYVELPGVDHPAFCGDYESVLTAIDFASASNQPKTNAERHLATALFTDIEDSTRQMAELGDRKWHQLLDRHDALTRKLVQEYRGRFIKSTGDGVLATFDGPERAVRCACKVVAETDALGLRVRAGLHAGEVEQRSNSDLTGLAVHIAARVMAVAAGGEVRVTRTIVDLTNGGDLEFDSCGQFDLKGIDQKLELFRPRIN